MIGLLWNIRGLGKIARIPALVDKIRSNHVDFVGIMVCLDPLQEILLLLGNFSQPLARLVEF
jgi:hypothetical protein